MQSYTAKLFYQQPFALGEGPVWWRDTLYWIDIEGHALHALRPGNGQARSYPLGEAVGSLVPWDEGHLLVALASGFARLNLASGHLTPLGDPEPDQPGNRLNDGKCDPRGRFVVGSMARDAAPGAGSVYRLDHDLSWERVYRPATISNGLAWSADGQTLYYIDTPTRRVDAFAYDLEAGQWRDPRTVVTLPEGPGNPDGMCIDADGNLWIALWGGWGVECWDPRTGRQLARIDLPAAQVTCPTFGGRDLDTLFITTARVGLDDDDQKEQPLAGSLFFLQLPVKGVPAMPFGGRFA